MGSIQNTKLQTRTQTKKPTIMKLLSYGLLAVLAFSAWADNRPQRSGTKLTRNRPNGQGQNRIIQRRNQIGKNGKKRRPIKRRINKNIRKFGRLGQIKPGKGQRKARNLIRNKKLGKPQRPKRNKASRKVREQRRQAARSGNARARNGRKLPRNGKTGQGYYQNDYYYYYDDPSLGAANPAASGYYDPEEYPVNIDGSENCVPANERITYWDPLDVAMQAIPGLTEEDATLLLEDVQTLTYGNTGKFLMQNGGVVSYTAKSHSLIVNEICSGTDSPPYPYPTDSPYEPCGYGRCWVDPAYYDYGRNGAKKGPKKAVKQGGRRMAIKKNGKQ